MNYKQLDYNLNIKKEYNNKQQILDYLKKGEDIGALAGSYKDPFNGERVIDNGIYSDGEYMWNGLVIYLFDKYSIELEMNFVNKINKKQN
ncbi:hypothetical protein [Helcococcus kunzii]|uniref:hypothetical protein n=1 Tax=Helcococcus kunzii TaxID=40091 RepID=UPI0024ACDE44|nr:hypothetical protein [Helcococcus kunzii]